MSPCLTQCSARLHDNHASLQDLLTHDGRFRFGRYLGPLVLDVGLNVSPVKVVIVLPILVWKSAMNLLYESLMLQIGTSDAGLSPDLNTLLILVLLICLMFSHGDSAVQVVSPIIFSCRETSSSPLYRSEKGIYRIFRPHYSHLEMLSCRCCQLVSQ